MRRILLLGAFVLAILFVLHPKAQAACSLQAGQNCSAATTLCNGPYFDPGPKAWKVSCCDTASQCVNAPIANNSGASGTNFSPFGKCGGTVIDTALGCIDVSGTNFVTKLLSFGIGIAGGIAFLLIIFGGFQILTSAGNPERLNAGKELISSAITGLLLIVFSVFLLKFIGVDLLCVPGFGSCI